MPQLAGHYDDRFAAAVGHSIRVHREAHGWSQKELATRTGINRQYLNSVENGHVKVSLEVFMAICFELGCVPGDILKGTPYDPSKLGRKKPHVGG